MQRFTPVWFHNHRRTELQAGCEIFGNRVGLDDVDHVFFQGAFLQGVCRRAGTELRRFAGFAVKDAVVAGKAVGFYCRSRGDNLFAGAAGCADFAHAFVAFVSGVEELAVCRCRLFADGEGPMNLCRVAPVADRQFGDHDTAGFEHAGSLALPRNEAVGAVHIRRGDEVDAGVAAVFQIGFVDNRQNILFR